MEAEFCNLLVKRARIHTYLRAEHFKTRMREAYEGKDPPPPKTREMDET